MKDLTLIFVEDIQTAISDRGFTTGFILALMDVCMAVCFAILLCVIWPVLVLRWILERF